jgi:hypothetical protein
MRLQRCTNFDCRRPFQINEFEGKKSGEEQAGHIVCPHCGQAETGWSNSVFLVHALSPEEEKEFNLMNPR